MCEFDPLAFWIAWAMGAIGGPALVVMVLFLAELIRETVDRESHKP